MTDTELEDLLRQLRPVSPPALLRAHVLRSTRRLWPWTAVAAALVLCLVSLQAATTRLASDTEITTSRPDPVSDLAEQLGGSARAFRVAEALLWDQQLRIDSDAENDDR